MYDSFFTAGQNTVEDFVVAGMSPPPKSGRVFIGMWLLGCIVIACVYSGNLIAYLSVYKPPGLIDTIAKLVEHTEIKIGVLANSAHEEIFKVNFETFLYS